MRPHRLLGALAVAALLAAGCDRGLQGASAETAFEPGQVWTYWTRPGEEASRVIVCRVEDDGNIGQIVHIHVTGLRMKTKDAPGGMIDHVGHMPYSADALRRSVRKLEATGKPLPPFEEGYHQWKTKFMQGRAGAWTGQLSEALGGMEAVMNQ